ncbi:hypothetical protein L6211_14200 [Pseudomonas syringae pv. syringae]|nr:hypothetical protein [Pseudomonas syringae]MCH5510066.1 hypothetical protein [Pseudomonas syringae pv. syringae]MCH5515366.1 hypothetical protein [Pseudomonas syringae pv. syringae]MCH5628850.1 hypothetical protein [Pseudomonas syringae pv. syringae]MCH5638776.1 hypothetical protein [Pseudomonas syringae pv. syringae]MCH7428133.1 hypothetical protein [Pseudomonas syringae pv. syringae]
MVVQDVSVGFDGLVCVAGRMALNSGVDFAFGAHSLCLTERWIFNLVAQTSASSVDGDLACEQAPIRPRHFWAVAGQEGFA